MRRLALLLAGGALWLILAASAAYADGGPHQLTANSGTGGLNGDCAACHRAHTAQAADLLKASMPGLCTTCHNGTGATTDVVDGVQFTPTGDTTFQQTAVLGALRGGGFDYALIGTPARLTYNSRGGIIVTFDAKPSSGTVTLDWPSISAVPSVFAGFAGGSITIDPNVGTCGTTGNPACAAQTAPGGVDALFGTSPTYTSSTGSGNMSSATASNMKLSIALDTTTNLWTVTFSPQNEFRLVEIAKTPTIPTGGDTTTQNAKVSNLLQANMGEASKVGVLAVKAPTTSVHEGVGTVWGNGPQGQGNAGATGVALECTGCHNPHGNGQYRILNTLPGEDWSNNATEASTTLSANVTSGSQSTISVASATDFPKTTYVIKIGTEEMLVTGGQGTTTWTVTRGYNGTTPGAPASGTPVAMITKGWSAPVNAVEVADVGSTATTKNYTVLPAYTGSGATAVVSYQASDVHGTAAQGDYFRYKYDPTGAANFTNFYLKADPMNTGWAGTPTNKATNLVGGVPTSPANTSGLLTAWCITCHTRYNGYSTNGTTSLVLQTPSDSVFMYKHGTSRIGCEQCHVSHGTNATMTAPFSSSAQFPDGTHEDSALLKVANRGTCNLCHDPTHTVKAGTTVGSVPGGITPGP